MKRFLSCTLCIILVFGLVGCASKQSTQKTENPNSNHSSDYENGENQNNTSEDDGGEVMESKIAYPSTAGKLHVEGTKLCGENGAPVQLRGLSTHGIGWYPQFVNDTFFGELKSVWGANIIRLAMYTYEDAGYCVGGDQEKLRALVKNGVNYATANDLYVIIDWHILNEGSPLVYMEDAKKFFAEMSEEFAGNINVIYEICNEPCKGATWDDIKTYANTIIPIIRANDEDAVIIVGTPNWSQDVDVAAESPLEYENLMYALHFYAATHKEQFQNKMKTALSKGLPIFVSEYGICDASGNGALDKDSAKVWIDLLNENDISYCCWNISNKNESSALFKESCTKTSGFTTEDMNEEGVWLYNMLRSYL